jgi:hypothetical protein
VRAWRHPEAIAGRRPRPWLFTVMHNLAIDARRVSKSRLQEVSMAALRALPDEDDTARALESWPGRFAAGSPASLLAASICGARRGRLAGRGRTRRRGGSSPCPGGQYEVTVHGACTVHRLDLVDPSKGRPRARAPGVPYPFGDGGPQPADAVTHVRGSAGAALSRAHACGGSTAADGQGGEHRSQGSRHKTIASCLSASGLGGARRNASAATPPGRARPGAIGFPGRTEAWLAGKDLRARSTGSSRCRPAMTGRRVRELPDRRRAVDSTLDGELTVILTCLLSVYTSIKCLSPRKRRVTQLTDLARQEVMTAVGQTDILIGRCPGTLALKRYHAKPSHTVEPLASALRQDTMNRVRVSDPG